MTAGSGEAWGKSRAFGLIRGRNSGFFHFADLNLLVLSLAASRGRFVDALDRYVSRRPMAPLASERWLDFGHLHTYYSSRSQITTERAFNGTGGAAFRACHRSNAGSPSSSLADR